MRQLKALLLVAALSFSSAIMANNNLNERSTESSEITNKIGKLLKNPAFEVKNEITANVRLTMNDNNELVVLSVDTNNYKLESFIKNRLNYKKVTNSIEPIDGDFIVPVRVKPEE